MVEVRIKAIFESPTRKVVYALSDMWYGSLAPRAA
jgi:hypothetical protein